jgi:DNA-binding PadR family transcriptional regulator
MTDYQQQIRQSLWQGMVKLVILHQASMRPVYGGGLSKYLCSRGYKISPGTLYPLLHALEQAGYLRCQLKVNKGRLRKYYETTALGQSCLSELRHQVCGIVKEIIINRPPKSTPLAENHSII